MSKLICCIGDSLTAGDYGVLNMSGIANVKEKNYPYFLEKLTGFEIKNFGYCGARAIDILGLFKQGIIDVTGADIIILLLGTNGGNTPEGNSDCDLAYKEIIKLCQEQSPKAQLFLCTPPHATTNPKSLILDITKTLKTPQFSLKTLQKQHIFMKLTYLMILDSIVRMNTLCNQMMGYIFRS